MSGEKILVAWIDDDFGDPRGDRKGLLADMENNANGLLEFQALEPDEGVYSWLAGIEAGDKPIPDIILIDLFLKSSNVGKEKTPPYFNHGTKIVGLLSTNDRLEDVPKYLVSRALSETQTKMQTDQFDRILTHNQLAEVGSEILVRDAQEYRKLREALSEIFAVDDISDAQFNDILSRIVGLLRAPDVCQEQLELLVRKLLGDMSRKRKAGLGRMRLNGDQAEAVQHFVLDVARWVRSRLLKRAGLIVDDLLAATMLGAKVEPFRTRIAPILEKECSEALYAGLFYCTDSRRWWREAIVDWAYKKFDQIPISSQGSFSKMVAHGLGLNDTEEALCVCCKKKWPETTAVDHDDPLEVRAVHWACSSTVDEGSVQIGFDELREFCKE